MTLPDRRTSVHKAYRSKMATLCEKDTDRVRTSDDWAEITCKRCLRFKPVTLVPLDKARSANAKMNAWVAAALRTRSTQEGEPPNAAV